ncbi:uncharacterized protein LOC111681552 [Lucilia cuprina]|uniref:uncharacterized protein LOC111681552 n=1 Tax=Lucilia cuprina TaxID=7375 RepID=UPI001F05C8FA|nr:uncharacterized protein LOC111681552 [Lucilia cuprina]
MKLQLIILLISLALVSAKFELRNRDDALRAHEECREDNYVPDEIYEKFLNYEFPDHKRTKCYVKCWVEKMELFKERKGFDEKSIVYQFTHEHPNYLANVRHGLEKCIDHNESESDVCTFAHRVFSCWIKINRPAVRKVFADLDAKEGRAIAECLDQISTNELLEKFKNYANWTYEEIPCFARCVVAEKGWFDIDHHRWNKQKIVDDLGENLYNYCRYEFSRPFKNVCTYAFKGLKCLKDAELNVIVTYSHLLECINEKATSMSQLLEYYHFPKGERIPCLFNCFANRAQLYDNNNEWIIKNWLKAFGPPRNVNMSNVAVCRVPDERRKTMNVCAWMYEEYNCWERFNYNTNGSVAYRKALRKSNGQKML